MYNLRLKSYVLKWNIWGTRQNLSYECFLHIFGKYLDNLFDYIEQAIISQ